MKFYPQHEIEIIRQNRELWDCMTEQEKQEYQNFLPALEELCREEANSDRRQSRRCYTLDEKLWNMFAAPEIVMEGVDPSTRRKKGRHAPSIGGVDLDTYYPDDIFREAVFSLSEPQLTALLNTVIYEHSTKKEAERSGSSERNVRKLQERALNNICKKYAKALKTQEVLTVRQRKFLELFDAGKPKLSSPPKICRKKKEKPETMTQRYNQECGPCVTVASARRAAG